MERPSFVTEDQLRFLDRLDKKAAENMFVSIPGLLRQFPQLRPEQAQEIFRFWLSRKVMEKTPVA